MMDKLTLELKEAIKDLRDMGYTDGEILLAINKQLVGSFQEPKDKEVSP